jgi:diguanylate cyclase (GGDEF)-like protein/PAS domain S-box-containing protein
MPVKIRTTTYLLAIFMAVFCAMPSPALPPDHPPTFLILHSYDCESRWTNEIHEGIMSRLATIRRPFLVYTEYLDWKRFPDRTNIDNLLAVFRYKYRNSQIDVIITSDDKALEFATLNRKEIFGDAPIVFTGVYKDAVESLKGRNGNITGVYEDQDVKTTLLHALSVQPGARRLYLLNDLSESGKSIESRARAMMKRLRPDVTIWSLSELGVPAIESTVAGLTKKDIVFIGSYSVDPAGNAFTGETLIGRVSMASKAPVYVLNTHQLGTGALGGNLLNVKRLGEHTGDIALRILDGTPVSDIKPFAERQFTPMFDWDTVMRLKLAESGFPRDAVFINREIPFIVRYWTQTLFVGAIFAILVTLLAILYNSFRKEKRLSKDLAHRNGQIQKLNDTLTRTGEELRQKYREITIVKDSLEKSEERYRLSSIGSTDALWDWDSGTREVHYSARWYDMTGYEYVKGNPVQFLDIIHPADKSQYEARLTDHIEGRTDHFQNEARIRIANGNWKWVLVRGMAVKNKDGQVVKVAGSITDIDGTKHREEKIESLAFYDQLTTLPNRAHAIELAKEAIAENDEDEQFGLMFIDIDNFKYINDTFGHTTGDKILVKAAQTLASLVNENISIARFGGDEFVALVSRTSSAEMKKYARLTMSLLGRKMMIDGRTHFLTISAGIAMYPEQAADINELIQKADAALHRVKQSGKTRYMFFDDAIRKDLLRRVELENGLRTAIDNGELSVAWQPQIDLITGKIAGLEALARWNSPRHGSVSPADFIPIAEESGQIAKIGIFVLRAAARFIKRAESVGHGDFTISVNISVRHMQEEDFVKTITSIMREENVPHERISLEITESFMIGTIDPIIATLEQLRAAGFTLSLDDFGKGYSSLSYLRSLPIQYIKIDKSFIDDIVSQGMEVPLARTIIELSHELGLKVVAEGVEVAEQIEYLRRFGCDLIQGYYYSRPTSEDLALGQLELSFN